MMVAENSSVVNRRIKCSSKRAAEDAKNQDPEKIYFQGHNGFCYATVRAKDIVRNEGFALNSEVRVTYIDVDLDRLSPLAREIAESSMTCTNVHRENDYVYDTGVRNHDVNPPSEGQENAFGSKYFDAPYKTALHWPMIQDGESGESYFEKCAILVELSREMLARSFNLIRVANYVNRVSNYRTINYSVEEMIAHFTNMSAKRI